MATLPKPYTMKHAMLPVIRRRTTGGIVVSDDHNAANNDIDTELDLDPARSELSNLAQVGYVNIMVRISPSRRPKI